MNLCFFLFFSAFYLPTHFWVVAYKRVCWQISTSLFFCKQWHNQTFRHLPQTINQHKGDAGSSSGSLKERIQQTSAEGAENVNKSHDGHSDCSAAKSTLPCWFKFTKKNDPKIKIDCFCVNQAVVKKTKTSNAHRVCGGQSQVTTPCIILIDNFARSSHFSKEKK